MEPADVWMKPSLPAFDVFIFCSTGCHNALNFNLSAKSLKCVQDVNEVKGLKGLQIITSNLVASYFMKK